MRLSICEQKAEKEPLLPPAPSRTVVTKYAFPDELVKSKIHSTEVEALRRFYVKTEGRLATALEAAVRARPEHGYAWARKCLEFRHVDLAIQVSEWAASNFIRDQRKNLHDSRTLQDPVIWLCDKEQAWNLSSHVWQNHLNICCLLRYGKLSFQINLNQPPRRVEKVKSDFFFSYANVSTCAGLLLKENPTRAISLLNYLFILDEKMFLVDACQNLNISRYLNKCESEKSQLSEISGDLTSLVKRANLSQEKHWNGFENFMVSRPNICSYDMAFNLFK